MRLLRLSKERFPAHRRLNPAAIQVIETSFSEKVFCFGQASALSGK